MGHCACPHLISGPSRGQWKTPAQAEPADVCSRLVLALLMRAATQEILQLGIAGVIEGGDMNLRSSRYELQERQNNFLLTEERRSCSPRPLNRKSALKHALFSHHPTRHGRDPDDIPSLDSLLPDVMRAPPRGKAVLASRVPWLFSRSTNMTTETCRRRSPIEDSPWPAVDLIGDEENLSRF